MQCTCRALAVQLQCSCSAVAVQLQWSCSVRRCCRSVLGRWQQRKQCPEALQERPVETVSRGVAPASCGPRSSGNSVLERFQGRHVAPAAALRYPKPRKAPGPSTLSLIEILAWACPLNGQRDVDPIVSWLRQHRTDQVTGSSNMTEYHDHVSCSREKITSPSPGFMAWIDSSAHDLTAAGLEISQMVRVIHDAHHVRVAVNDTKRVLVGLHEASP